MASQRKRRANRRNAKKSTGPRTARGKAICSRNAITHGLLSQSMPVLPFENEFEYRALAEALERDLQPQGILQRELVTHIAQTLWRIRRVPAIEAALLSHDFSQLEETHALEKRRGNIPEDEPMPQGTAAAILAGHFARTSDRPYERLEIYRQRLERSLATALRQLEKLRGKTAGEEIDVFHQTLYLAEDAKRIGEKLSTRTESGTNTPSGPNRATASEIVPNPRPDNTQRVDARADFCEAQAAPVSSPPNGDPGGNPIRDPDMEV